MIRRLLLRFRGLIAKALHTALDCLNELGYEDSQLALLVTYSPRRRQFGVLDLDRLEEFTAGSLETVVDRVRQLADRDH